MVHRRETVLRVLTIDHYIELHDHGVQPGYIQSFQEAGFTLLTVDEIIDLSERSGEACLRAYSR